MIFASYEIMVIIPLLELVFIKILLVLDNNKDKNYLQLLIMLQLYTMKMYNEHSLMPYYKFKLIIIFTNYKLIYDS